MKKIAFPTDDGETISRHPGQAQFFQVAVFEDSGVFHFEKREKSHHNAGANGSGHHEHSGQGIGHSMFASIADCHVLISGGMGQSAYQRAQALGLEVLLPGEKNIYKALEAYRSSTLESDMRRIHKH
jgi:predicted Fe-Mo cluster-binding NifX family protein